MEIKPMVAYLDNDKNPVCFFRIYPELDITTGKLARHRAFGFTWRLHPIPEWEMLPETDLLSYEFMPEDHEVHIAYPQADWELADADTAAQFKEKANAYFAHLVFDVGTPLE
jgi:hypothetical protein